MCDELMRRTRKRNVPDAGVRAPRASGSMADSPAGKAGVGAEDGSPHGADLPWGGTVGVRRHSGPPVPITGIGPKDRLAGGNRLRTRRGGRMPTGVTRGTLSFYLRVSPPRFPARTRAVCSFGAPRMEALQRLVGQQSFRLKDSLRRRPMPFAAGWGLSCCRHPKPSVNGGVSGWRGKRKRHHNTPEYIKKYTGCAHNTTCSARTCGNAAAPARRNRRRATPPWPTPCPAPCPQRTRNERETPRPTPAPGGARPSAVPSVPPGR